MRWLRWALGTRKVQDAEVCYQALSMRIASAWTTRLHGKEVRKNEEGKISKQGGNWKLRQGQIRASLGNKNR